MLRSLGSRRQKPVNSFLQISRPRPARSDSKSSARSRRTSRCLLATILGVATSAPGSDLPAQVAKQIGQRATRQHLLDEIRDASPGVDQNPVLHETGVTALERQNLPDTLDALEILLASRVQPPADASLPRMQQVDGRALRRNASATRDPAYHGPRFARAHSIWETLTNPM